MDVVSIFLGVVVLDKQRVALNSVVMAGLALDRAHPCEDVVLQFLGLDHVEAARLLLLRLNLGMGVLLMFFALSLFGMYEIELPHFLSQYTSSREGQGCYVGVFFMELTSGQYNEDVQAGSEEIKLEDLLQLQYPLTMLN